MKNLRIALAVFKSDLYNVEKNLARTTQLVIDAKQKRADIICFPELNLTGYNLKPEIKAKAQPVPGPASGHLLELAERYQIGILAGLTEVDREGQLFASHLTVLPSGAIQIYRKIHLAPPEKEIFSRGDIATLSEFRGVTFGVQLCYDAHFPELSTLMALKGADIIFFPHASPRGTPQKKIDSWMRHLTARAFDNGIFVAACNLTGSNRNGISFPGVALVISPVGEIIAKYDRGKEGLLVTDLSAKMLAHTRNHAMRYFLPNRQPDVYTRLFQSAPCDNTY